MRLADRFVNPYNFIGFPKEKAKAYEDTDRHTGVIEYTITTKTPLFIPNSSSEAVFKESQKTADHKSYDFFSYTDISVGETCEGNYHAPVIPGSEIRGVVRNVYETLTDSCMGLLNEEEYPVKRSVEMFKPGLLHRAENGLLTVYPAESLRIGEKAERGQTPAGFGQYKNGETVYYQQPERTGKGGYKPITRYGREENGFKHQGYLLKWGMGVRKSRYHIFKLSTKDESDKGAVSPKGQLISLDDVSRRLYRVIDSYLEQPALKASDEKAYKEYKSNLEDFLRGAAGAYFPVTYSLMGKRGIYLAPAVFSKEISTHTVGELAGVFAPCKGTCCPACDLFGHVGDNAGASKGSRIRFTDLYAEEKADAKDYYTCDKITLETLGGPKLGNVDFYLKKPENAEFWNYDYYVRNGKVMVKPGELRGRKYYWHHRKVELPAHIQPSNLNKTVRPVKEGICFKGKLYFDGISEKQLRQLLWILNSGNEDLGLKLGAAKPLGLGSVACKVVKAEERKIEMGADGLSYVVENVPMAEITYEAAGLSETVKAEFYKIAGLHSLPEDVQVTYPRTPQQKDGPMEKGFEWFVANHGGSRMRTKRTQMQIIEPLPPILAENVGLPYQVGRDGGFQPGRPQNGGRYGNGQTGTRGYGNASDKNGYRKQPNDRGQTGSRTYESRQGSDKKDRTASQGESGFNTPFANLNLSQMSAGQNKPGHKGGKPKGKR